MVRRHGEIKSLPRLKVSLHCEWDGEQIPTRRENPGREHLFLYSV